MAKTQDAIQEDRDTGADGDARSCLPLEALPVPAAMARGDRPETAVVSVNAAWEALTGRPVPAGVPLPELTHHCSYYAPDHATPVPWADFGLARAIAEGEPVRAQEVHVHRPDGEWRVLLVDAAPIRDGESVVGAVAVLHDITEQRAVEACLREGEERFRALVEATSDWIWEIGRDWKYTYASPKVRDLLGYEPAEVLGKTPFDLMPPDEAARLRAQFAEIWATRRPFSALENRNLHKDGHVVVLETSGVPIFDAEGDLCGYRGIDRDITRRKRVEDALRLVLQTSEVMSASLDREQVLAMLAERVVPALGDWCILYAAEEGGSVRRVAVAPADPSKGELARRLMACPPLQLERVRPHLRALRTGRIEHLTQIPEALLQALATGGPEHLSILKELGATSALVVPLVAHGRFLGVALFFLTTPARTYDPDDLALAEDVAHRAAIALDNARLYQEARQASEAKDRFLAVLSHELRNQMAPILAGIAFLHGALAQDARSARVLATVERSVRLQERLVEDLLDLSRIARGRLTFRSAPVNLRSVVYAAFEGALPDAKEAGLTLILDAPDAVWVQGDADRLRQVVANLLGNSVKFTPAPGEVHVGLRSTDGWARIEVVDTGVGIPRERLSRIFNLFEQGPEANGGRAGLGIGLALARSIVERHRGRIWAESEGPDKGSRFVVELPCIAPPTGPEAQRPA